MGPLLPIIPFLVEFPTPKLSFWRSPIVCVRWEGGVGQDRPWHDDMFCLTWRPYLYSNLCLDTPSHNHLPLLLRHLFHNRLQDVNLHNFSRGQTSLDKLMDGLVGAQVPQGHTGCHSMAAGECGGHRKLGRQSTV